MPRTTFPINSAAVREAPLQHLAQHAEFALGASRKTTDAAQQDHHYRYQRDQPKLPDLGFKATLHPFAALSRSAHCVLIVD